MAIRLVRCSRIPRVPLWAAIVALAWGGLAVAAYVVHQRTGVPLSVCLFKNATGVPCPTCGGTRVVARAAGGDVAWSFATNPAVFVALVLSLAWLLLRVVAARRVDVGLGPRGRRVALVVGLLLVVANWAYLVAHGT